MGKSLTKYKSNNRKALLFMLSWLIMIICGVVLSASFLWWLGQLVLGIAFFQAFILLHETGHYSFFEKKKVNTLFGYFFGFVSLIPFTSWVDIHNQHHKWTGWRDKDPTTTGTINPKHGVLTRMLVNTCWFLCLPLFTIGYRIGNYWDIGKIKRFSPKTNHKKVLLDLCIMIIIWTLLISLFLEQFLTYVLFNFNLHEKHHEFPGLPAYFLQKEKTTIVNTRNFWTYIYRAKSLTGEQFVFSTSKETGREV